MELYLRKYNLMKKNVFLFTLLCVSLSTWAEVIFKVGDLYYDISSTNTNQVVVASVRGFDPDTPSNSGTITIPSTVTYSGITYSVTSIHDGAFQQHENFTSVSIPNSVTSIENFAFYECKNLTSVIIPNSVISIGANAFSRTGLISITIPESVISMDNSAFNECSNLSSVSINTNCFPMLSYCEKLRSVTIGDKVNKIPDNEFEGCKNLTSLTISNSVSSIGKKAFSNTGLTSILIPSSVTSIGEEAFSNTGLTSLIIPSSVTSIGEKAFYGCNRLSSLSIPSNVQIGSKAFKDCIFLTNKNLQNYPNSLNDCTVPNVLNYSYAISSNDFYLINKNIWSYYSDKMSEYNTDLKRKVFIQSQEFKRYDSIYNVTCQNFKKCLKYFILQKYSISDYNIDTKTFKISYNFIDLATSDQPYPKNYFNDLFSLPYFPTTTNISKSYMNMNGYKTYRDITSSFKINVNEEAALRIESNKDNVQIIFIFNDINSLKEYRVGVYNETLALYEIGRVKMVVTDKISGEIYFQKIYEPIKTKK